MTGEPKSVNWMCVKDYRLQTIHDTRELEKTMIFDYLARGIIRMEGKILLAHQKGAENTFLPGGHIGMGEQAETALIREISEEIGERATIGQFIGAVECMYKENGQDHHEINLVFELDIPYLDPLRPPESMEAHLEFIWAKVEELEALNLLPKPMIKLLLNIENEYHGFWGSAV